MNARPASQLIAVVVVSGLVLLVSWAAGAGPGAATMSVPSAPIVVDAEALPGLAAPIEVPRPQQGIGIVRVHSESFEDPAFPSVTTSKWSVSDRCAIFPGRSDVVGWGRRTCDASNGTASLWSVGGGSFGKALACGADYPATIEDPRRTCTNVDTILAYRTFNMSNQACLRVTFDYRSDMPAGALRVGIGVPDEEGNVNFTGLLTDFMADSGGEWQRGVIRNYPAAAGLGKVVLGFFYLDESGAGGHSGVMIDNIHVDALSQDCNAKPFPSPTVPTIEPTETEEPPEPTNTPFVIPPTPKTRTATPTKVPTRRPMAALPLAQRRFDMVQTRVPYNTAPPPTITPTPSMTPVPSDTPTEPPPPSDTPRPSRTPRPSATPSVTPRPSPTNIPMADVQIVEIREPEVGARVEIVRLMNVGDAEQPMDRWRLYNMSHSQNCRVPEGVIILPGASYEIRSGPDAVTDAGGYACTDKYVWDNHKDESQLYNEFNLMVSCYAYDANGPYNCMPAD